MSSQEQIKLINCFFEPSHIYAIYDYTKIVYPIDGYICLRQISTPQSKPSFIKMYHECKKVHAIYTYPNLIITLEQNFSQQFLLGFYDSIHFHTKLASSLAEINKKSLNSETTQPTCRKNVKFQMKFSKQNIFVLFSLKQRNGVQSKDAKLHKSRQSITLGQQKNDNELIVINIKSKRIVSRNFFSGNVKELFIKTNQELTVLFENSNLFSYHLYENMEGKQASQSYYLMKKKQAEPINLSKNTKNHFSSHIWVKDELIVMNQQSQQLQVYVQGKKVQCITMNDIKCFKSITPLMCGFLVANQNFLFVFKKVEISYVCIAQFFIRQIGFSPQLVLSPQQDIISYFMASQTSIQYITNFSDEVENQAKKNKKQAKQLKVTGQIQFKKDVDLKIYVSRQNNTFSITHDSTIKLYNMTNFQNYLEQNIQSEQISGNSPVSKGRVKRMNTLGSTHSLSEHNSRQQFILNVAIHPFCQLIAVALKSKIRVYQILYNELSHIKDISVSNCSDIFFSNSGQFLSVVVSGKNGSKCYIYKTVEDFDFLECLSIGKKVQKFVWTKYDNFLYGVHMQGYYKWSIQTVLKSRYETLFSIPFKINDAILNHSTDKVILYGKNEIVQINQKMDNQNIFSPKDIIKVSQKIKQIIVQNGCYFIDILHEKQPNTFFEVIIKVPELSGIQAVIQSCNLKGSSASISQNLPIYRENTGQMNQFRMIPCSGSCNRNVIFLIDQNSRNIKMLQWGKSSASQNAKSLKNNDLIKIDSKSLKKIFRKYQRYEQDVKFLEQKLNQTIKHMQLQLVAKEEQKQRSFIRQIKNMQQKYEQIKNQKQKLEHTIEQKIQKHEEQTIKEVKQLEKMYERKIAVTTNKLLTSEQINYRNMLLAEENLKKLQRSANHDVQKIREEYKKELTFYMNQKDVLSEQIYRIKKEYQSRLYDLEQQNQKILEEYQSKSQDQIQILKRNLVSWQIKFSEAISKKDNIQQQLQQQLLNSEALKQKMAYLQSRNREANKKCEYLHYDIEKYQKMLEQKNTSVSIYEQRINDLQKTNQILKYRVIELKGQTEPQTQQNQKLKQNLNELEQQYDKIVKSAFQKEQMLGIIKKQSQKSKQSAQKLQSKAKRIQKSYLELFDKIMNITKAPIQQIRSQLINLLNTTKNDQKLLNRPTSSFGGINESPLGQLNRIRQHLEICLNQAVDSNKKGEKQKQIELKKKNVENSQLITEINDLRRKVREFQSVVKQKDLQINRIMKGDPLIVNQLKNLNFKQNSKQFRREGREEQNLTQYTSQNQNQTNSRQQSRSHTRKLTRQTKQSFFQKSLFKSSTQWRQKRLKTEHTQQRNAYSRSIKRNPSGKYLHIQNGPTLQDIQDYKRIVEQKQTIIKQLINKIQSLS